MDRTIGDLAFLFITFAHATDGALSGEEMRTLAAKLREWQPDATLESIGEQLKGAVEAYKQAGTREARLAKAGACADGLAKSLDAAQRQTVFAQLRAIAEVDGKITVEEDAFLGELRQRLGA
jgi:hypothetical protein